MIPDNKYRSSKVLLLKEFDIMKNNFLRSKSIYNKEKLPLLLKLRQMSELMDLSVGQIRKMAQNGVLPAFKAGVRQLSMWMETFNLIQ